ncbi:MAG: hypothetical protein CBC55_03720 [Gammaproteobacteria bacterium TMED95]|nr:MAG: hypothetical protein CBC55_03720 [Gammaproteobacteria bacterium TMED95]|tara:strand:+ start:3012 stop:3686 length:675 start_codon:yes stop_codon:yes gene_type:complete
MKNNTQNGEGVGVAPHCNLESFIEKMKERHADDSMCALIDHLDQVCELIAIHLSRKINKAHKEGTHNTKFMNFWKISWRKNRNQEWAFRASFAASTTARGLTKRFIENGESVDDVMIQHFFNIIAKPPTFMELVDELTSIVYESNKMNEFFSNELTVGKNISYLLNVLFKGVLVVCYDEGMTVSVPRLGAFLRTFRSARKQEFASKETSGGLLQFEVALENVFI